MYSSLWTTIPQASIPFPDLVRYGCLQGCRNRQCSSPVYDPLCLCWQLWKQKFCKLMIVFKICNLKVLKIHLEGCGISAYIQIIAHIASSLGQMTLWKCKCLYIWSTWCDLVILVQVPYTKNKCRTANGHRSKRQAKILFSKRHYISYSRSYLTVYSHSTTWWVNHACP